jgi:light-regulated signal transduction histidine kinase (bacteriophytochrome)
VEWDLTPLPAVATDPAMLRQVMQNLIGNALKFTRGRPVAKIVIGSLCGSDGETIFFVRDNGAGFDMRYYDKMFQVFQRLHSETDFEGTGIGLAIVRRVVERQGGSVWAEGAVDEGATFYFTLPSSQIKLEERHESQAHLVS